MDTGMQASSTSSFDPAAAWRSLLRWVPLGLALAAAMIAGLLVLTRADSWWSGFGAATVASVLAALLSLIPLRWGLWRSIEKLMAMVLLASGVRAGVSIGLALVAVEAGGFPAKPTLLLLVPYYFVLLAVETACLIRAVRAAWR
jgi:hypothetical protein